jgi:hypothetical protein
MQTVAESIINFYTSLKPPRKLPKGVRVLHPQAEPQIIEIIKAFYTKYYSDTNPRQLLFGINPGRFGAGITGVNFTAPRQLTQFCHIPHSLGNKSELSAEFIYDVINAYGGPEKFYSRFFITSVSPFGYVDSTGKNLNYYADRELAADIRPWVVETIKTQLTFTGSSRTCICIGEGDNFKYLNSINDEFHFFDRIIPLPHPRPIMQYRRKQKDAHIHAYLQAFDELI